MRQPIDWAVAARPLAGQRVSGDLHVVEPFSDGVLVAVIDALGHGDDAAASSALAAGTLRRHVHEDVPTLFRLCHERLRAARGAVMSVALFKTRDDTVTWCGVGNVEGCLLRPGEGGIRQALLVRSGVIGLHVPNLRPSTLPIGRGDRLVMVTDGIAPGFIEGCRSHDTPRQMAEDILARCGKATDDALVLVAEYKGTSS